MKNNNLFDLSFKTLFLSFWFIIWHKWIALPNLSFDIVCVLIFDFLAIIYILYLTYLYLKKSPIDSITIFYRISVLLAFIFSLFTFVLYPKAIIVFYIKNLFVIICIYISSKKLMTYHKEDGLVGIIASILLLTLEFLY